MFEFDQGKCEPCNHIIRVAFESGVDNEFDYLVADSLWPVEAGQRVLVPFGRSNKHEKGFCVGVEIKEQKGRRFRLKRVLSVIDSKPLLDLQLMELARWISDYYVCPLGQVLAAIVPSAVKKDAGVKKQKLLYLAEDRGEQIEQLRGKKQKRIVAILRQQKAFDSKSAVDAQVVLDSASCTAAPVKRLIESLIVRTTEEMFIKALPVIPVWAESRSEKVILNADQRKALASLKMEIETRRFGVTLLHGVTDSGKTEVYIKAIEMALRMGKSAIVILPEIALTAQMVQRFSRRFEKIAVMHSRLSASQRNGQWRKIKAGDADVVIGARSAVFAPLDNLGLIVVDEEHEPSYKQDTQPRYNGRDVAIKRAQIADAHCLLGSATPSLETLYNCRHRKHFTGLSLPERVLGLPMPEMKLVDLKQQYSAGGQFKLISDVLRRQLKEAIAKKEQAILLLNRRGYSSFVFCPSCRHTVRCRNCDVSLTFHKSGRASSMASAIGSHIDGGQAVCHYCLAKSLVPKKCPLCGAKMVMVGIGSQRLEEELKNDFPEATVARFDSDSMQGKSYYQLLKQFGDGKIDILAGTQMLAKGLHFPNVTVVGIISADTCLNFPDFRSAERTFQLISQVAGRTGRSDKKGTVFVQTFLVEQSAIQFAVKNDYDGFVEEELKHRAACNLPPFWRMAVVGLRDRDFDKLQTACKAMRERIDLIIASNKLEAKVRGPVPAAISRMHRFHRMQIIVRAPEARILSRLFTSLRNSGRIIPAVKVTIDVDPISLL